MRLTDFLKEEHNDAYREGMRAFGKGGSCPYDKGTSDYDEWHLGFDDAKSDRRGGYGKGLGESESNYIAMSSYQAKAAQVDDEIEKLKLNMMKHRKEYLATDRTNWGYAGDMERLLKQMTEINDWLGKQ